MAITYGWQSYILGQPEPGYQPTTFLSDGVPLDLTTHANGNTAVGTSSDIYTASAQRGTGVVVDALLTIDQVLVVSQIQATANGFTSTASVLGHEIRIDAIVEGVWTKLYPNPVTNPSLDYGSFATLAFGGPHATLNLLPHVPMTQLRVRVKRFNVNDPVVIPEPILWENLWDVRLIGFACVVPSAPPIVSLVPTREPGGQARFVLTWSDSLQGNLPISYQAELIDPLGGPNTVIGTRTTGVDTAPYTAEAILQQGQEYCFRVVPYNECGIGTPTSPICNRIDVVVNPPNNFHGVEECEGNQVSLYWEEPIQPPDVDGYRIRRDGVLVATLSDTTFEWVDESPGIGVTHIYSIVAYNSAGESPPAELTKIPCEWNGCVQEPIAGTWAVYT